MKNRTGLNYFVDDVVFIDIVDGIITRKNSVAGGGSGSGLKCENVISRYQLTQKILPTSKIFDGELRIMIHRMF